MSSPREGLARSVQVRLGRHAREIGVDPNLVLTRYAVERFLYRLSRSPHTERFVLKGALLMLVWLGEGLRPTSDADLLGFGELSEESLGRILHEVAGQEVEPDAVVFEKRSVRVEPIRAEDEYGGWRATLRARVGAARLTVQVDVGVGDAVTPAPEWLDYPGLLDLPSPRLRAYPRESVIAEKVHAIVRFGTRNSRMKDYFDLHALAREGVIDAAILADAIAATFERRATEVPKVVPPGLRDSFASEPSAKAQWKAFLARNRLEAPALVEVVGEIRDLLLAPLRVAHARAGNST
ncbi:MAG: nucleotidyl transferase AbiEii/AbiGii toxin family protein [Candidatus Eisenbacteria bacterium]|uniref:Nucleotidyl transferase AbiEii/AbiGii toxin family protein n=1 Tax=Eiseniibacteriota bacterium TaxID=2212470 RepID=A0A849SRU1_UNCEI|nr:nucleotidyl transferase AbiEii/AbiGii toxin family protein [Candidatus Eisenbacteria bacterium]